MQATPRRTVGLVTSIRLRAQGTATVEQVWERYARPDAWATWSPQITSVQADGARIVAGMRGTVRGPLRLPVRFLITAVDDELMTWSWKVHVGPVALTLHHSVTARATAAPVGALVDQPGGSSTTLDLAGPAPIVLGYAPLAQLALRKLVSGIR